MHKYKQQPGYILNPTVQESNHLVPEKFQYKQ